MIDVHAPRSSRRWLPLVALSGVLGVIAAATLTPGGGAAGSGSPLCVTCSATWLADAIANVALFVPLGAVLCWLRLRPLRAVILGAAVSLCIELLQYSGHPVGRTASVMDLGTNTLGTGLGVWLAVNAPLLLVPSRWQARWLVTGWSALLLTAWGVLDVALAPATPVQSAGPVRVSELPFAPGYGWLQPEVRGATVNGTFIVHHGNGPVMVATVRTDSVTASVRVPQRDARPDVVPIVFVHDPAMRDTSRRTTRAHLFLAQRGNGAWLSSDVRAGRWGLVEPALLVRGVFRDEALDTNVVLSAVVTRRRWQLETTGRGVMRDRLTLSPLIGWSMLQALVPVHSPVAPLMTVLWVALWVVPFGYWLWIALRRESASRELPREDIIPR